ncbi:putative relaxase/mobilization nuclease domain, partial [Bacteroides fragilis str. S23 R14]
MVAKISVGKSLYGALAYNGEKANKEQGKLLATNRIYNDGTGTVEEVRGNVRGRKYNGLVYSVVDESGNKAGNPFKSVLYGKSVGYETVQGKFVRSRQELTEQRGQSNPFELP